MGHSVARLPATVRVCLDTLAIVLHVKSVLCAGIKQQAVHRDRKAFFLSKRQWGAPPHPFPMRITSIYIAENEQSHNAFLVPSIPRVFECSSDKAHFVILLSLTKKEKRKGCTLLWQVNI